VGRRRKAHGAPGTIPWAQIMSSLPVWAIVVNNFTFHYTLYVLMNWLPTYFDQGLHASLASIGPGKSAPYFMHVPLPRRRRGRRGLPALRSTTSL